MRVAPRLALPLVALAALAVLGQLRPQQPALVRATQGSGSLTPTVIVRVVADGHPRLVAIPVRAPEPAHPAAPPVRQVPSTPPVPVRTAATAPSPGPAGAAGPVRAATAPDTYPWAADTSGGPDPWGFTTRQCVSYVAWRLAGAGRAIDERTQGWGSALDWDEAARRLGRTVTRTPQVGAVAQWDGNEASPYWTAGAAQADGTFVAGSLGHVAWVLSVYPDGSVLVAQYNGTADRAFSTMRVRAPRYLLL